MALNNDWVKGTKPHIIHFLFVFIKIRHPPKLGILLILKMYKHYNTVARLIWPYTCLYTMFYRVLCDRSNFLLVSIISLAAALINVEVISKFFFKNPLRPSLETHTSDCPFYWIWILLGPCFGSYMVRVPQPTEDNLNGNGKEILSSVFFSVKMRVSHAAYR
jgi:hypothetical protein